MRADFVRFVVDEDKASISDKLPCSRYRTLLMRVAGAGLGGDEPRLCCCTWQATAVMLERFLQRSMRSLLWLEAGTLYMSPLVS